MATEQAPRVALPPELVADGQALARAMVTCLAQAEEKRQAAAVEQEAEDQSA